MKRRIVSSLILAAVCGGLVFVGNKNNKSSVEQPQFAKPGMVAYAASYSSDPTAEPKYSTQNNTTFKYLNLRNTHNMYRGDSVKVGIIDSGINYDHEDFMVNNATKVKGDSKYYSYSTTDSKWYYYGATSHGYSYIDDTFGHGTNVAATVAAAVNGVGGLGLAPNVELYVYKVTNSSNGYQFGAIQLALRDAVTLGLDVINMSFQSYEHAVSYNSSSMAASSGCSSILSSDLNSAYNAGITLVGAAGNFNTSEPSYPGSNNHVINVGSLNSSGTDKAGFSNYGSTIDLVAPGYVHVADEASNTAYTNTQGTSFSAPLVTAAIALYKQQNPSASPAQIEAALYASCDEIDDSGSQYTNWAGHGALNVAKFLGVDGYPTDIDINNPEIVGGELTMNVGDELDLDWTVNGSGDFSDEVEISVLSGGVVSVTDEGHVVALSEGEDIIEIVSKQDSSVYVDIVVTVESAQPSKTLTSISVSGQTTSFVEGDTFAFGGTVTAHFSDSTSSNVTANATFTGYSMTTIGQQTVTVSYTYENHTETTSYSINVNAGTLSSISLSGQTTTYLKNSAFSFDGTCTANFANGYHKTVTPTSITAPDMSTAGVKTITVSYTYNNVTRTAQYDIVVNANRTVIETITTTDYQTIGTITYPNNTQTISTNTLSVSTGGYTNIESNSLRMGSGSDTGSITVTSTTSNITKVVVSAKSYGSDSSVHLTVGGDDKTITSSYANYSKEYTTATNSVAISTVANKKRAYIQTITVYRTTTTTTQNDISTSADCVGLETFISTYMHMDYTDNLGYCNDEEHHYYSSAKSAFNSLNTHQRSLFVGNSAYLAEFNRLKEWAKFNGDSLNTTTNQFERVKDVQLAKSSINNSHHLIIIVVAISSLIILVGYVVLKRRKESD